MLNAIWVRLLGSCRNPYVTNCQISKPGTSVNCDGPIGHNAKYAISIVPVSFSSR